MRHNKRRDANDWDIFDALKKAGRDPIRCTDFDIAANHVEGFGVMIENKVKNGSLRPLQAQLQAIFKDRYLVCRSVDEALKAVGIKV